MASDIEVNISGTNTLTQTSDNRVLFVDADKIFVVKMTFDNAEPFLILFGGDTWRYMSSPLISLTLNQAPRHP